MAKRFRFSSYWGTWSLVLTDRCKAKPGYGPTVEIDLSPVNGWDCGATCNSDATRGPARLPLLQANPVDNCADEYRFRTAISRTLLKRFAQFAQIDAQGAQARKN